MKSDVYQQSLLTTLRSHSTCKETFQKTATHLAYLLADQIADLLPTQKVDIKTPMGRAEGVRFQEDTILVPILRSGMAILPPFQAFFPKASIAVLGIRRNEETKEPVFYYENFPSITKGVSVIILDPMLATAGTVLAATSLILKKGIPEENIFFAGVICSAIGRQRFTSTHSKIRAVIAAVDPHLGIV